MKLILLTLLATTIFTEKNNDGIQSLDDTNVITETSKPQVIINRVVKDPKVITERVIGKTRYITDTFVEPTRQQIIVQPRVNRVTETLNPVFIKGEDKFVNNSVTEPTIRKYR